MPATDYIPARDADFADWSLNFATLIAAAPTTYGLVAGDATAISGQNTAYQAAYLAATNPATRTAATIATARGARISAEAVYRPYAMRVNANQSVTDAQRANLGLTIRTTTPTPVPPPTTSPALMLEAITPGQHVLQFRDASTPTSKRKPAGAIQLEVFRHIGTTPAPTPATASYIAAVTKTPFVLSTPPEDRGKVASYFARWVTRGGPGGIAQPGPWSVALDITCG